MPLGACLDFSRVWVRKSWGDTIGTSDVDNPTARTAQKLTIASGKLLDAAGSSVDSYSLAPGDKVGANQWALLAKRPLKPGARYTVDVSGQVDGQAFSKRWSFTVA